MTVAHNRPDIILVEKAIQKWKVIDIVAPSDFNVVRIEDWKVEKYQDLALEVKRIQDVETAILPVAIGALQSWTLIICTFTISTGFHTTSEVGGSFYIYKSKTYRFFI